MNKTLLANAWKLVLNVPYVQHRVKLKPSTMQRYDNGVRRVLQLVLCIRTVLNSFGNLEDLESVLYPRILQVQSRTLIGHPNQILGTGGTIDCACMSITKGFPKRKAVSVVKCRYVKLKLQRSKTMIHPGTKTNQQQIICWKFGKCEDDAVGSEGGLQRIHEFLLVKRTVLSVEIVSKQKTYWRRRINNAHKSNAHHQLFVGMVSFWRMCCMISSSCRRQVHWEEICPCHTVAFGLRVIILEHVCHALNIRSTNQGTICRKFCAAENNCYRSNHTQVSRLFVPSTDDHLVCASGRDAWWKYCHVFSRSF